MLQHGLVVAAHHLSLPLVQRQDLQVVLFATYEIPHELSGVLVDHFGRGLLLLHVLELEGTAVVEDYLIYEVGVIAIVLFVFDWRDRHSQVSQVLSGLLFVTHIYGWMLRFFLYL